MKFEEARKIIEQKYETRQKRINAVEIVIRKQLRFGHYYYILLMDYENEALLTDYAETRHILKPTVSKDVFEEVCKNNKITFVDGYIEKKFESIEDVDNFVKVLDELSAKYAEREDQEN